MGLTKLLGEPAIHFRMVPDWTLGRSGCGRFLAGASDNFPDFRLTTWSETFRAANQHLNEGAPLSKLHYSVLISGNEHQAATYLAQLERLARMGLVEFPLVDDGQELAVIAPQQESFVPSLAARTPDASLVLHHLACLRRDGNGWLVESPLSGARLKLANTAALDRPLVRRALDAAGFLEMGHPETGAQEEFLSYWEFHDLIYHTHSRRGWHRDPSGAHLPFIGMVAPSPARRPDWPGVPIELPCALDASGDTLIAVLKRRRSERAFDDSRPVTISELGSLLDRAARSRSFRSSPQVGTSGKSALFEVAERPCPSAGAIHELEIYPIVRLCDGLDAGMYHYDSWRHALVRIPADEADLERMLWHAQLAMRAAGMPQVVLAVAARFPRVFWRYQGIGYGNILRNTGALYQTLYLVATELGLSACALGSADSMLFAKATGLDPLVEGTVGDFVVGSSLRARR